MEAEHGGIVHLVNMVAGQDQHVIRVIALDKGDVLIDRVGCALVPFGILALGIGRQDLHAAVRGVQTPRLAVADVLIELQRLILRQDADRIDLGVYAVGKREIDNAVLAAERDGRLGRVFRQNHQTAALTTCQEHGDTTFFLKLHSWISSCILPLFLCSVFVFFYFIFPDCPLRADRNRRSSAGRGTCRCRRIRPAAACPFLRERARAGNRIRRTVRRRC